jgi:hypothetical protein
MRSRRASRWIGIVCGVALVVVGVMAPTSVSASVRATAGTAAQATNPRGVAGGRNDARRVLTTAPNQITLSDQAAVDTFVQTQELSTPNGLGDHFGEAVAIEGNTMVVVAPRDYLDPVDNCGYGVGYVYIRQPGSPFWDLTAHLRGSDHNGSDPPGDCYGYWGFRSSVAIHGATIAIGAGEPTWNDFYPHDLAEGKVYIFRQHDGAWTDATEDTILISNERLTPPGGDRDLLGAAIGLQDENTLVVGAPYADGGTGAVYIYTSDGSNTWDRIATLQPPDLKYSEAFGDSLGVSGRTIVVGNYSEPERLSTQGIVAVFDEPADGWVDSEIPVEPTAYLPIDPSNVFDSVAIDGDTIVVGGFSLVSDGVQLATVPTGATVFERADGAWDLAARLFPSEPFGSGAQYGSAVAVQDSTIVVADRDDDEGTGAVYVYRKSGASWGDTSAPPDLVEAQKLVGIDAHGGDFFDEAGRALALDGSTVVVGAPWRAQPNTSDCDYCGSVLWTSGGVFVYVDTTDTTPPTTTITRDPAAPNALGWDKTAPVITVSATDNPDGSGVFQVRCQVDGDTPATFDKMAPGCAYDPGKAFTTQSIHTLYAASIDSAGNRSAVISLPLKVDTIAPASTVDLSPTDPDGADGSYTTPVTVTLNPHRDGIGSEIEEARCAVNPATPPASFADLPICASYWFYPGVEYQADGDYTVWVALKDGAGNEEMPHSRTFSIHSGPTTTISLTPSTPTGLQGWYNAGVTVSVTATAVGTAHVVGYRCVLDPATPPTSFTDMADTCPYAQGGAKVSTEGRHVVYAASRDDHGNASSVVSRAVNIDLTPPTVTCDGNGPASFILADEDTEVTATVTDKTSGPSSPTASTPVTSVDLATVGNGTKTVSATDVAGNQTTVNCAYVVGYDVDVIGPADGATFKAGATVSITFRLRNASGVTISDADAAVLLGGKKKPCLVVGLYDGAAQTACATYAAATDLFTLSVKTPKGRTAVGAHQVGLQIKAPNGSGVVNVVLIPILLN